jgi:hypothetical protein
MNANHRHASDLNTVSGLNKAEGAPAYSGLSFAAPSSWRCMNKRIRAFEWFSNAFSCNSLLTPGKLIVTKEIRLSKHSLFRLTQAYSPYSGPL